MDPDTLDIGQPYHFCNHCGAPLGQRVRWDGEPVWCLAVKFAGPRWHSHQRLVRVMAEYPHDCLPVPPLRPDAVPQIA